MCTQNLSSLFNTYLRSGHLSAGNSCFPILSRRRATTCLWLQALHDLSLTQLSGLPLFHPSFIGIQPADSHPYFSKTLVQGSKILLSQEVDTCCSFPEKFISQMPPWLIASFPKYSLDTFPHLLPVLVKCHLFSEAFHNQTILNDQLCSALSIPFSALFLYIVPHLCIFST